MDKRHVSYGVLYSAIAITAVLSFGLASFTTAEVMNSRPTHSAAPISTSDIAKQKQERKHAAANAKAERQQEFNIMKLFKLRHGSGSTK